VIILFMATIGLNYFLEGMAQAVWDSQVHALELGIEDVHGNRSWTRPAY
jgi:branched-chain amino acid transport system permease protein